MLLENYIPVDHRIPHSNVMDCQRRQSHFIQIISSSINLGSPPGHGVQFLSLYLCELAARSQRRTKSSFIEAAIDEKIHAMPISSWRDTDESITLGERADFLWHVREQERLISLGLVAPHLMTFEEQEIWATICENGHFWRGRWVNDGDQERWEWSRRPASILRERVEELWPTIVQVARGEADKSELPQSDFRPVKEPEPEKSSGGMDDEIPF